MINEMTDAEWEARNDADTLARAEEIRADAKRLKAARKAAEDMAVEEDARAKALKSIASDLEAPKGGRR